MGGDIQKRVLFTYEHLFNTDPVLTDDPAAVENVLLYWTTFSKITPTNQRNHNITMNSEPIDVVVQIY